MPGVRLYTLSSPLYPYRAKIFQRGIAASFFWFFLIVVLFFFKCLYSFTPIVHEMIEVAVELKGLVEGDFVKEISLFNREHIFHFLTGIVGMVHTKSQSFSIVYYFKFHYLIIPVSFFGSAVSLGHLGLAGTLGSLGHG